MSVALKPFAALPSTRSITTVCRAFGVTPRAIRLYEERGLISCERDGKNGRLLDGQAQARLQAILELKCVGLSLAEIEDFLAAPDGDRIRGRLRLQLERLETQMKAISGLLRRFG